MSKNILIVDDEKLLTETLAEFFQLKGQQVFCALEGDKALEIIRNRPLDIVLLDIKLPGVDGLKILEILRKDYTSTKVIVMTAYDVEYKKRVDTLKPDAFFIKPIFIEEIQEKVKELLEQETQPESAVPLSTQASGQEEKTLKQISPQAIPKARILIVGAQVSGVEIVKGYLLQKEFAQAEYEAEVLITADIYHLSRISHFRPDVILYDIAFMGLFSEFASKLINLSNPPKEIILFGEPQYKYEEVDSLIGRGMKFIPLEFEPNYAVFTQDTLLKIKDTLREVCFKHNLCKGE